MRRLACESGGREERNLITSDGYIPNQITHGTGWKWHPAVVLARESNLLVALIKKKIEIKYVFLSDASNIAKFSSNVNWKPSSSLN